MKNRLGKQFVISGMTLKIIADAGDKWETLNTTTKETIFMDKQVLDKAIKLGKAEEVNGSE